MHRQRASLLILSAVLFTAASVLLALGGYGSTLFIALPLFSGGLGAAIVKAETPGAAARAGAFACFCASFMLLLLGREGAICLLMATPLTATFGAAGGLLYHWMSNPKRARAALLLIPLPLATSAGFDATAKSPVYEVHSSIQISAPPDRVWQNVIAFGDVTEPREWYFKTGLAYPKRTRLLGGGVGARRYCDLSTGPVVETVTRWQPSRLLEFEVSETPPPMVEWSPYGTIEPKHLHGYMISKRGRFVLTPLDSGRRTLVEGTSWYQHGLYPAFYWRLWSDQTVHWIHRRVLNHIRSSSESPSVTGFAEPPDTVAGRLGER